MRRLLVLLVSTAMLPLVACGHFVLTPGSPSSPTPSPTVPPVISITEADQGRTLQIVTGQEIDVVLHGQPGPLVWHSLRSSDPSVLAPEVNSAATAMQGVLLGAFRALKPGHAQITAVSGPICPPGAMCPMVAERLFVVDVIVTR